MIKLLAEDFLAALPDVRLLKLYKELSERGWGTNQDKFKALALKELRRRGYNNPWDAIYELMKKDSYF